MSLAATGLSNADLLNALARAAHAHGGWATAEQVVELLPRRCREVVAPAQSVAGRLRYQSIRHRVERRRPGTYELTQYRPA